MAYDFIKLSEVPLSEMGINSDAQNVIIEEGGEIKRIPVTDFASSTETSTSHYLYYTISNDDCLYKLSQFDGSDYYQTSIDEFMNDYTSSPIMILAEYKGAYNPFLVNGFYYSDYGEPTITYGASNTKTLDFSYDSYYDGY